MSHEYHMTCMMWLTVTGEEGARQENMVNWYLGEIEGDIESVEMLAEKKVLVEKVIERLIHHVSVLA